MFSKIALSFLILSLSFAVTAKETVKFPQDLLKTFPHIEIPASPADDYLFTKDHIRLSECTITQVLKEYNLSFDDTFKTQKMAALNKMKQFVAFAKKDSFMNENSYKMDGVDALMYDVFARELLYKFAFSLELRDRMAVALEELRAKNGLSYFVRTKTDSPCLETFKTQIVANMDLACDFLEHDDFWGCNTRLGLDGAGKFRSYKSKYPKVKFVETYTTKKRPALSKVPKIIDSEDPIFKEDYKESLQCTMNEVMRQYYSDSTDHTPYYSYKWITGTDLFGQPYKILPFKYKQSWGRSIFQELNNKRYNEIFSEGIAESYIELLLFDIRALEEIYQFIYSPQFWKVSQIYFMEGKSSSTKRNFDKSAISFSPQYCATLYNKYMFYPLTNSCDFTARSKFPICKRHYKYKYRKNNERFRIQL